jgi:hypothetical protein
VTPGAPRIAYLQLAASMALVGANVAVAKLLAEALPIPMIAFLRCVLAVALLEFVQMTKQTNGRMGLGI